MCMCVCPTYAFLMLIFRGIVGAIVFVQVVVCANHLSVCSEACKKIMHRVCTREDSYRDTLLVRLNCVCVQKCVFV